jgi:hypothetical protein
MRASIHMRMKIYIIHPPAFPFFVLCVDAQHGMAMADLSRRKLHKCSEES